MKNFYQNYGHLYLGGFVACLLMGATGANASTRMTTTNCSDGAHNNCRVVCRTPIYSEQNFPSGELVNMWENIISYIDQGRVVEEDCREGSGVSGYGCHWVGSGSVWSLIPVYQDANDNWYQCARSQSTDTNTNNSATLRWENRNPFYELQNLPGWARKIVAVRKIDANGGNDTRLKIFGQGATGNTNWSSVPNPVVLGGVTVRTNNRETVNAATGLIQLHVTPAVLDSLGVPRN